MTVPMHNLALKTHLLANCLKATSWFSSENIFQCLCMDGMELQVGCWQKLGGYNKARGEPGAFWAVIPDMGLTKGADNS